MRIVAGSRRGLRLDTPAGLVTRPTSERAREALFNILTGPKHRERLIERPVADLFAGTGALGIEALSRGAESCAFVESDPTAFSVLKGNLIRAKFGDIARTVSRNALEPIAGLTGLGIVFADPPYRDGLAEQTMHAVIRQNLLAADGILVLQAHPKTQINVAEELESLDDRRYGAARFLILARKQAA